VSVFLVLIASPREVFIEAPTAADAIRVALDDGRERTFSCGHAEQYPFDAARLSTYTCEHCGKQALKEMWGPGRVTCPHCGKAARSAAERSL